MDPSSRAVIVKDGTIIATGINEVNSTFDLTSHAEIMAIRNACRELGSSDLSECQLYTTSHPCPMCVGACQMAQVGAVYYVKDNGFVGSDMHKFLNNCSTLSTHIEQLSAI